MYKKLTALLTAAALAFSAAPLTVTAQDELPGSPLPDWIPRDYVSTIDFYNAHGATYIQDGFLCFIQAVPATAKEKTVLITSEPAAYTFTPPVVLTGKEFQEDRQLEPLYEMTVHIFKPEKPGELTLSLVRDNSTAPLRGYTFNVTDAGIEETDIYSWVPDSVGEYDTFDKANPTFSLHNGYIVYCDEVCTDGGYSLETNQIGTAAVEKAAGYSCSSLYAFDMPCGESYRPFILYKATTPGTVKMTAVEARTWAWGKEPLIQCDEAYYEIDENLGIKEIAGIGTDDVQEGDLNRDGKLDEQDVDLLSKYLHNQGTLDDLTLADINHDGSVDVFDLGLLQRSLLLQSPWEDGELQFTSESCMQRISDPERYTNYKVKLYGNLENLKLDMSIWDANSKSRVYAEPKTITDETFKEHTVLLVTSPAGSGSREMTAVKVERRSSRLVVHVEMKKPLNPTPDEAVFYAPVVLDQNVLDGIQEIIVEEHPINEVQVVVPDEPIA